MKNNPLIYEELHKTALSAPKLSGVYLWKDENQTVIYIGKAKNCFVLCIKGQEKVLLNEK